MNAAFKGALGDFTLDVAFDVAPGVTGLLGPSGSGKTTILRCLAGLERLSGHLTVADETWQDARRFVPPERRRIGYVFQGANLLPHLNVRANLAYAMKRAPAGRFEFDEVVARIGIAALLDRSPARLSGGEAQRVAIARALIVQPKLLLLDEPFSALDAAAREDLLGLLETLLPRIGVPAFYVSHDAAEVARLATRTLRMRDGRLEP
jgi:molybdate transport system ATP-binding protein